MFKSVGSRFVLRAFLSGVVAGAAVLQAMLPGISQDDLIEAGITALIAANAYAGIGAAVPWVEPNIGIKKKGSN